MIKLAKNKKGFLRTIGCLILTFSIIASQSLVISAFEAHIINVTAHVCRYSETRTMGYWKTHINAYFPLLPQILGAPIADDNIDTPTKVQQVFLDYNLSMRNKLRGQLLAMKFNIAGFGIGDYLVETENKTLNQLVDDADALLRNPNASDADMETMKNLLDNLNNLHQIRFCSTKETGGPEPALVINEVYYDLDSRKACSSTESDPSNEWIEIYNPTEEPIDISGFTI